MKAPSPTATSTNPWRTLPSRCEQQFYTMFQAGWAPYNICHSKEARFTITRVEPSHQLHTATKEVVVFDVWSCHSSSGKPDNQLDPQEDPQLETSTWELLFCFLKNLTFRHSASDFRKKNKPSLWLCVAGKFHTIDQKFLFAHEAVRAVGFSLETTQLQKPTAGMSNVERWVAQCFAKEKNKTKPVSFSLRLSRSLHFSLSTRLSNMLLSFLYIY